MGAAPGTPPLVIATDVPPLDLSGCPPLEVGRDPPLFVAAGRGVAGGMTSRVLARVV